MKRTRAIRAAGSLLALTFLLVPVSTPAQAAEPLPEESRFQRVVLVTGGPGGDLTQPMRMAVAPDGRVVFVERDGRIKVWSPATQSVVTAGGVSVRLTGEVGMIGLALAQDFATTGHIYLHYSRPDWSTAFQTRVSRWTLTPDNTLDPTSEVTIIDIQHPIPNGGGHSAGDLQLTPDGDLFIVTGDNTNCCASAGFAPLNEQPGQGGADSQKTSSNSNDLNGKILRIHPLPGGGYSIPDGNLFPLQADGSPQPQTKPEIYAMGFRNPFTIGDYDPVTKSLWMADYGPDAVLPDPTRGPAGHVEMNLITQPGFFGWPYCIANNLPYNKWNYATQTPGATWHDCAQPQNTSPNNTGIVDLPPATPATIYWTYGPTDGYPYPEAFGGGAMAGPMYRYDAANPSPTKFPEWFDGRRFFFDWTTDWIASTLFSSDLKTPVDVQRFLPNVHVSKPMDLQFGADGSLYVLAYGNGWGTSNDDAAIYRIDYVSGNRLPAVSATASANSGALPLTVNFDASATTDPDGDALSYAWDFDGNGTTDATGVTTSHVYTTAGDFQARLAVTDSNNGSAIQNFPVVAGNTRPSIEFLEPADGTFSEFGVNIPFKVKVTDPEDGPIDCTKVLVSYSLGHNSHAHPMAETSPNANCEGTLVPGLAAGHNNAYVYSVIQAQYTDGGGVGGTQPLVGTTELQINPRTLLGNTYPRGEGVGLFFGQLFIPDSGNWFMFPRFDLRQIERINVEASARMSGANFTVHADSPTGPVVARVTNIQNTGATSILNRVYRWSTSAVTDPGGVHDLYFVADWADPLQPELFVRTVQFITTPSSVTATVAPPAPNGANDWYTSNPVVTVSTGGMPLWTRQTSLNGGATWTNTNAQGQATVSTEGVNNLMYRAVDSAGVVAPGGELTLKLDKTAPTVPTVGGVSDGASYGDSGVLAIDLSSTDATSGVDTVNATIDGVPIGSSVQLYTLPLGSHTLVATATDKAGLQSAKSIMFTTTTSFADMRALVERLITHPAQRRKLLEHIDDAVKFASKGDYEGAIRKMNSLKKDLTEGNWGPAAARAVLVRDADAMIASLS